MKFKSKLSKKQIQSIFFLVIGLVLLIYKFENTLVFIRYIGILLIAISVLDLYDESIKRYKIINPFNSNKFDSKAEEKIADYFKRKNIIYHHHYQIKVPKPIFKVLNIPFVNLTIEPDFFLPEFNVFVEYWGMIDDPKYKEEQYDIKKKLYKDNELDLISLYPKNLKNLDFAFTSKLLDIIKEREGNDRVKR